MKIRKKETELNNLCFNVKNIAMATDIQTMYFFVIFFKKYYLKFKVNHYMMEIKNNHELSI